MTDRAKVIQGIHRHCEGSLFDRCDKCPYYEMDYKSWDESKFKCRDELLSDVSDLLKEQEAKEQEAIDSIDFVDRTEIMANLEGLTWDDWRMYHSDTEVQNIAKSAFDLLITLLEGHEPIEPVPYMDGLVQRFACGKCGKHLLHTKWGRDNYCSKCGQEIKWE